MRNAESICCVRIHPSAFSISEFRSGGSLSRGY
jgi:hypothetical protein